MSVETVADSDANDARPAPLSISAHTQPNNLRVSPEDAPEGEASLAHDRISPVHPAEYSNDPDKDENKAAERAQQQPGSVGITLRQTIAYAGPSGEDAPSDTPRPVLTVSGPEAGLSSPAEGSVALSVPRANATLSALPVGSRLLAAVTPSPDLGGTNTLGSDIPAASFPMPRDAANTLSHQSDVRDQTDPESKAWHLMPKALAPLADALPIDLDNLRRHVDTFFARLANVADEDPGHRGPKALLPWLIVASAVAFEFARLRGRSPVQGLAPKRAVGAELHVFSTKDEP